MVINMNKIKKICALILLAASIFLIGACCSLSVQAKESDAETAYQEFLSGTRTLYIDEEMHNILNELSYGDKLGDLGCGNFSMKQILKKVNESYYDLYEENNRIASIEYAYLDCGSDGSSELAVRFNATSPIENFVLTFIIVYEEGKLSLRHAFEAWTRNQITLNRHGYIWEYGNDGAFAWALCEAYIGADGRVEYIFDSSYWGGDIEEPEICQQVYGVDKYHFLQVTYLIDNKEYHCLFQESEESSEDENFIQFKKLYEKKNGRLYTQEEIDKRIEKRRKKLGVTEEIMEENEPDWILLENTSFRNEVREIDLKETRKSLLENGNGVEISSWEDCENLKSAKITFDDAHYHLEYYWEQSIANALRDYCYKKKIQDTEWTLLQHISYGDNLYAVTVQSEEERVICLLLSADAAQMDLPEYTEYLTVMDCHWKNGEMVYDSALLWESFEKREAPLYSYEVEIDKLYSDRAPKGALRHYLSDQKADTGNKWKMDSNAICYIEYGAKIVRFISEGQEIIMAVDYDAYEIRYSVIKRTEIKNFSMP